MNINAEKAIMILESGSSYKYAKTLDMTLVESLELQRALTEAIRRNVVTKGMIAGEEIKGGITVVENQQLYPGSLMVIVRKD